MAFNQPEDLSIQLQQMLKLSNFVRDHGPAEAYYKTPDATPQPASGGRNVFCVTPQPARSPATAPLSLPVLSEEDRGPKQLIIRNLVPRVTELELRRIFEEFGEVEVVRINYNLVTGTSRGYGFVYFVSSKDAAEAVKKLHKFELYGKLLRVGYANPQRVITTAQQRSSHIVPTHFTLNAPQSLGLV